MKNMNVMITASVGLIVLGIMVLIMLMNPRNELKSKKVEEASSIVWAKSRDWDLNDGSEKYGVEFGFRSDGVVLWRKGEKK